MPRLPVPVHHQLLEILALIPTLVQSALASGADKTRDLKEEEPGDETGCGTWELGQCCSHGAWTHLSSSNKIQRHYMGLKITACLCSGGKFWTTDTKRPKDQTATSDGACSKNRLLQANAGDWACTHRHQFSSVQSLRLFATPWAAAHRASLSISNCQSLLKPMSVESVMSSNHFIFSRPLLLPSIFPSISLFQWVSSLNQVVKGLEFQLQHQSFQWIFRTDFL